MPNDPKYVRLATRLQGGMICDVQNTGWSIAGLDVKEFPEDRQEARYVRSNVNSGKLEPASKAEYEAAHDTSLEEEVLRQSPEYHKTASAVQEGALQKVARAAAQRVAAALGVDEDEEYERYLEELQEDRDDRLRQQEEMDLDTDDPEEQVGRTTGQRPRRTASDRTAAKSKGKGKKKESASEEA